MDSQDVGQATGSPYDVITGEATHARQVADFASALDKVPLFTEHTWIQGLLRSHRSEWRVGSSLTRQCTVEKRSQKAI